MNTLKVKFYSYDLRDAIGLAACSLEEGPNVWACRADFHIEDIAQYNPKHPSIKAFKDLKKQALKYLKTSDKLVNSLRKK